MTYAAVDIGNSLSSSPSSSVDMSATVNCDNIPDLGGASAERENASTIFDDVNTEIPSASMDEILTLPSFKPAPSMNHHGESYQVRSSQKRLMMPMPKWSKSIFKVPSGACGKQFLAELTRFLNALAMESDLEAIALMAAMTLPSLLLQKQHAESKHMTTFPVFSAGER